MRISVAHHFWQNNENATWCPTVFPAPEIESAVKSQYERLQTERPEWRKFGDYCVFFDYRPGKDVFGRIIVPISFAFLRYCRNPARSAAAIRPILAETPNEATEIDVDLPWEEGAGRLWKQTPFSVKATLMTVAALSVAVILFMLFRPAEVPAPLPPVERDLAEPDAPKPAPPAEEDTPGSESAPAVQETQETAPPQEVPIPQGPELCSRDDIIESLFVCPAIYVRAQCGEGAPALKFDAWLEKTTDSHCDMWKRGGQRKYRKPDHAPLSKRDRRLLEDFFKNKR